jgi:hypothetical protein
MADDLETMEAFWPYYLREHSQPATRAWHFAGTTLSLLLALGAVFSGRPLLAPLALIAGYGCAWYSHFFIEKNKPATFKHPLKSLVCDGRMWLLMLTGRLGPELERAGVVARPATA